MTDVSPKLSRKYRQCLILITLCQWNVQCVRNSVLGTVQSYSDKSGTILFFDGNVGWTLNNMSMDFLPPEQISDFIYLFVKIDKWLYRIIINDCSRSKPCPCYDIFAASLWTVNFCQCQCHFLGGKCGDENFIYLFLN
jgi:hypothetical protein